MPWGLAPCLLACLLLLAAPSAGAETVRGTISLRDGGALPAGAVVSISLRETAGPSRLGRTVLESRVVADGGARVPFLLPVGPAQLRGQGYALSVRVQHGGRAAWHNVSRVAVDPARASVPLSVQLVPVEPPATVAGLQARKAVAAEPLPLPPAVPAAAEPEPPREPVARPVAAAETAAAEPPPAAPPPAGLRCTGNEPGWSLVMEGGQARLVTQDSPGRQQNLPARYTSAPWAETPFGVLRAEAPGVPAAVAFLTAEACADSMSGEAMPMRARLSLADGTLRTGCCRPVHAIAQAAGADWSRNLPALLPAVQACTGARPGVVLAAWPTTPGRAAVRIAAADGARVDCTAEIATRRTERIAAVAHADRLPGEGQPTFRIGQAAEAEACRRIEPVRGPDSQPAGALAWDICR